MQGLSSTSTLSPVPSVTSSGVAQAARAEYEAVLHQCLLDQLRQWLSAQGAASKGGPVQRYALISAGQCEDGAVAELVQTHELEHERLFLQTPEAEMADIGPWLIELPPEISEPLLHALAQAAAQQALSLLHSPVRQLKLAAHLRSFMYGSLPDGSPVLLRYFDPRIGFDMAAHWSPAMQQQFAQPIARWAGWDGALMPRQVQGAARAETAPLAGRLPLDAAWCQAMDEAGLPHLVTALLAEELEESDPAAAQQLAQIHPVLRRQIAQEALTFCRTAGLTGWDSRLLACRQALLVHPRFHAHPAVQSALAQGGTAPLPKRLARVPANAWQECAQDREPMLVRLYDSVARALLSSQPSVGASSRTSSIS